MNLIKPQKLNIGDTIGIIAPSFELKPEWIADSVASLKSKGFKVKLSKNIFSNALGFAGMVEERVEDFNVMIKDNDVKMLLFGGGEVCNEIMPFIDYEAIKQNPKIICSYSDSTTLLNAIYAKTGLFTFYGASLRTFEKLTDYNWQSFESRFRTENMKYEKGGEWQTIHNGKCVGKLIGGYLVNFAVLQNGKYFSVDKNEKYILFIEDNEKFSVPAVVSKYFSHLEQCGLFENVVGLIFGHYSTIEQPVIVEILKRLGDKYNIPVVKNDDFGHGINNAVLPIGIAAELDADNLSLEFLESGVV